MKEGQGSQEQTQPAAAPPAAGSSSEGGPAAAAAGLTAAELVCKDIPHMPAAPLSHLKRLNDLMKTLVEEVGHTV
jgi:hypothetical protein